MTKRLKMDTENKNPLRLMTRELNEYIDYTNLKIDSSKKDIENLCLGASVYNYYSVCINPSNLKYVKKHYPNLTTCVVIGYPNGYNTIETKVFEASEALLNGADEIDVVWNLNYYKNNDISYIKKELKALNKVCKKYSKKFSKYKQLKVIVEIAYLSEKEIREAVRICSDAGVDFIKTSSGVNNGDLNTLQERQEYLLKAIEIMYSEKLKIGSFIKIKASGSIKDKDFAILLIQTGADRIGTSQLIS